MITGCKSVCKTTQDANLGGFIIRRGSCTYHSSKKNNCTESRGNTTWNTNMKVRLTSVKPVTIYIIYIYTHTYIYIYIYRFVCVKTELCSMCACVRTLIFRTDRWMNIYKHQKYFDSKAVQGVWMPSDTDTLAIRMIVYLTKSYYIILIKSLSIFIVYIIPDFGCYIYFPLSNEIFIDLGHWWAFRMA